MLWAWMEPYQQSSQAPATNTQPSSSQAHPAPARASPGNSPARTQRRSHLTASAQAEFTFGEETAATPNVAPLAWPPRYALYPALEEKAPPVTSRMVGMTPVPFTPTHVSRISVQGAAPAKLCQMPDEAATVCIPAAKLSAAELAALQAIPSAMVTLTVPASTLLGVLKRTDILSAPVTPALTSDTHLEPASPPDASPDKAAPTAMVATTIVPPTEQALTRVRT